jgi:uncharacterized cofD-like protein
MIEQVPKIVVIGGGTGSFTLLSELKKLTSDITAIVSMSDDGGSTGVLRDELGVLPPGDIRQCLVALSDSSEVRELFNYRFSDGRFEGQSLGNIILSGLELQHDNLATAIKVVANILHIKGRVIPVTLNKHTLLLRDGADTIEGENLVGHRHIKSRDAKIELLPSAHINPEALAALARADIIVIAPGNVFGSLLPVFAVEGVAETLLETNAKLLCVTNLVTMPGQTDDWHPVDFVKEYERYIGKDRIDVVLYNTAPISQELLESYAVEGEYPVNTVSDRFQEISARAIGAPLVSKDIIAQDPHDTAIRRTLIRHDAKEVSRQLLRLL